MVKVNQNQYFYDVMADKGYKYVIFDYFGNRERNKERLYFKTLAAARKKMQQIIKRNKLKNIPITAYGKDIYRIY